MKAPNNIFLSKDLFRWSLNGQQDSSDIEYIRKDINEKIKEIYSKIKIYGAGYYIVYDDETIQFVGRPAEEVGEKTTENNKYMKSIFTVKFDNDGYHGIEVHNENIIKTKDGVDNPYAYHLCLNYILECLIRMEYSEDNEQAVSMLKLIEKKKKELKDKFDITKMKYGL